MLTTTRFWSTLRGVVYAGQGRSRHGANFRNIFALSAVVDHRCSTTADHSKKLREVEINDNTKMVLVYVSGHEISIQYVGPIFLYEEKYFKIQLYPG